MGVRPPESSPLRTYVRVFGFLFPAGDWGLWIVGLKVMGFHCDNSANKIIAQSLHDREAVPFRGLMPTYRV